MSTSTVSRPTENAAIGRVRPPQILPAGMLLEMRVEARRRVDRLLEHLIGGAIARSLDPKAGE